MVSLNFIVLCPLNTVKRGNDDLIDAPLAETNYFLVAGSAAFLYSAAFFLAAFFPQQSSSQGLPCHRLSSQLLLCLLPSELQPQAKPRRLQKKQRKCQERKELLS